MAKSLKDRNDFQWGINIHNRGYKAYPERNLEDYIRLCAELGSTTVRLNCNPHSEGDYVYLDKAVQLCADYKMDMMLVLDDMFTYKTEAEYEQYHAEIATHYKGKIKYYQVFNETDNYALFTENGIYVGGDGSQISQFYPKRLEELMPKVLGSIKGLRKGDSDAQLVINCAWWHIAILEYYMEHGAKWDIIGIDWYSKEEETKPIYGLFDHLLNKYPEYSLIICETNFWANDLESVYTDHEQAEWNSEFAQKVYRYPSDRVKGMIFYELMDEPTFEVSKGSYHGESHFGFIECDLDGNILRKKQTYDNIKELWK